MGGLLLTFRALVLIAAIGLVLSGGSFVHLEEIGGTHASSQVEGHLHGKESHGAAGCCDAGADETAHCGANLLALDEQRPLFLTMKTIGDRLADVEDETGVVTTVEQPPPRPLLA